MFLERVSLDTWSIRILCLFHFTFCLPVILLRIPSDGDQRSEVMAITIPNSCRSRFRVDGDRHSDGKPITFRRFSE
jgi:hypothetical protein